MDGKQVFLLLCLIVNDGLALEVAKEFEIGALEMLPEMDRHQLLMNLNYGCPFKACSTSSITLANLTIHDNPPKQRQHHWIWTLFNSPAIQVSLTHDIDNNAKVDWTALFRNGSFDSAITYQQAPDYSAAIMLANLIEFDDTKDLGYLDPSTQDVIVYPLSSFAWNRTVIENTTERVAFELIAENFTASSEANFNITQGKLNITFSAYALNGFGHWLPHLTHSESTNQIDIQLDKLESNSGFNCSRFALEIYLVSNAQKRMNLVRQNTKTLDDEHTPGIFTTQELVMPGYNATLQAYLQWRPVVYTSTLRDLSASTDVNITNDISIPSPAIELKETILYAFYGEDLDDMMVRRVNVSMGVQKDGFYKKTKYQAWTVTFGTGTPIHNGMSPMIVLVITVMFGIMFIVLLTSCVICVVKKVKKRRSDNVAYGRIDE